MPTTHPRRSYTIGEGTLSNAADLLETLANLNYLACLEAHNPGAVRQWTGEADICIKRLGALMAAIIAGETRNASADS